MTWSVPAFAVGGNDNPSPIKSLCRLALPEPELESADGPRFAVCPNDGVPGTERGVRSPLSAPLLGTSCEIKSLISFVDGGGPDELYVDVD